MQNHPDPFDELAAMFLTAPHPQAPATPSDASRRSMAHTAMPAAQNAPTLISHTAAMTELLIVGNMPVRAGLWLVPYADALARQLGAVALVRLDGAEPTLQLLRAHDSLATAPLTMPLAQTIRDLTGLVDVWMLRAREGLTAEEALDVNADRITILSSADEAAVVAAYQTVKDLAAAAEHAGRALPGIGLAIVGADQHAAATVIDRLNRTTVSFLGVEMKLVALLPRIDAGIRCTRYLTFGNEPVSSVVEVRQWIEQAKAMPTVEPVPQPPIAVPSARSAPRPQPRPIPQPDVIGRIDAPAEAFVVDARRILRQPSEPMAPTTLHLSSPQPQPQSPPRPATPTHAASPPVPTPAAHAGDVTHRPAAEPDQLASFIAPAAVKLPPKVVIEFENKPPHTARDATPPTIEPDDHGRPMPLAKFVTGLSPLPVRAPGHERIEIAVDNAGVMHLLARDDMLRELPVVERWAHAHRELIAMACSQHRFDSTGRTLCHVFASEPLKVADLHASNLRLHVLAPVSVGDKTAWYAAPLNIVTG